MRERCYYCGRFISVYTALFNHEIIQAPGVADPEPYEITCCDACEPERKDAALAGGEGRDDE